MNWQLRAVNAATRFLNAAILASLFWVFLSVSVVKQFSIAQLAYDRPRRKGLQQFANGFLQNRMHDFRSNLGERFEYEAAFSERGMGNGEAGRVHDQVSEQ